MKVQNGELGGGITERPKCERCKDASAIRAIPEPGGFRVLCNPCWIIETDEMRRASLEQDIKPIMEKMLDERFGKFTEEIKNELKNHA